MFEPILLDREFGVDQHPNKPDAYMITRKGRRFSPPGRQCIFESPESAVKVANSIIKEIEEAEERENKLSQGESDE